MTVKVQRRGKRTNLVGQFNFPEKSKDRQRILMGGTIRVHMGRKPAEKGLAAFIPDRC
jgi:hypothetical protein